MSRIDLRFAEIHAPLFLLGDKGKNLGTKLDPKKQTGLTLVYDRAEKELLVSYLDMEAIIPATNVVSMLPMKAEKKVAAKAVKAAQKDDTLTGKPIEAQVSTPQTHVHAGPGHGQTGQEPVKGKGK